MRTGINPFNDKKTVNSAYHRIIVPVFIPNLEDDYFSNGLELTRLSIESLIRTHHSETLLTVINNGSCKQISDYLQGLFEEGKIHQLVHHYKNLGKIDAIISVARTCEEPLITISDGDVLFKQGWMQGVENVFVNFPEAGMVSPVPHGTVYPNYTVNTLFDGFFKRLLKFQSCCDPDDMLRFSESIGRRDSMYQNRSRLKYQLTVKRGDFSAVVGCGHFVATLRNEVFRHAPQNWSHWAYATIADREYIDIPNEKAGKWRLATVENFAYHMGNCPTDWMREEFDNINSNSDVRVDIPISPRKSMVPFWIKKAFVRILLSRYVRPKWFRRLGLKEFANEY